MFFFKGKPWRLKGGKIQIISLTIDVISCPHPSPSTHLSILLTTPSSLGTALLHLNEPTEE